VKILKATFNKSSNFNRMI